MSDTTKKDVKRLQEAVYWLDYQSRTYYPDSKGLCTDPSCDSVYCYIAGKLRESITSTALRAGEHDEL